MRSRMVRCVGVIALLPLFGLVFWAAANLASGLPGLVALGVNVHGIGLVSYAADSGQRPAPLSQQVLEDVAGDASAGRALPRPTPTAQPVLTVTPPPTPTVLPTPKPTPLPVPTPTPLAVPTPKPTPLPTPAPVPTPSPSLLPLPLPVPVPVLPSLLPGLLK